MVPSCAGLCQYQVGLHQLPTCCRVPKVLWMLRQVVGWWFSREPSIMRPLVCSSLFLWPERSTRTSLSQTTRMFKPSMLPPYTGAAAAAVGFIRGSPFPHCPGNRLLPAVLHTCLVWRSLLVCLQLYTGRSLTLFHYLNREESSLLFQPLAHTTYNKIVHVSQLILFEDYTGHLS